MRYLQEQVQKAKIVAIFDTTCFLLLMLWLAWVIFLAYIVFLSLSHKSLRSKTTPRKVDMMFLEGFILKEYLSQFRHALFYIS